MRVLFVIRDIYLFERFGIMQLSSILKTYGHEVDIVRTLMDDVDAKVAVYKPDIVAYSLTTGFHQYYLDVNRKIKEKHNVVSVFGGPHPTFFPEVIKEEGVDVVCVGEGEQPMAELADALSGNRPIDAIPNLIVKTNGRIKSNPARSLIENLDALPFPDRELLYKDNPGFREMKVKAFFSGRGCPYKCSYCFNHTYNEMFKGKGKVIRKRSVDNLLREIKEVKEAYPLEVVRFMDDVFILGGKAWLEEFSEKYKKEIGLPFVCMARADLMDEEVVKTLKEAGCRSVYMAIEAGNDRIRNDLLRRNLTKEKMIRSSRLCHTYGIRVVAENIIGLPSETVDDMFETLRLNLDCLVDLPITSIFNPYPGTELAKYAQENGYFEGDYDKIDFSFFKDSPLNFSKEEKRRMRHLRSLFNIAVGFPALLPVMKYLIRLPLGRLYELMSDAWHAYCLKFRIFPHPSTAAENVRMLLLFLKRNRG